MPPPIKWGLLVSEEQGTRSTASQVQASHRKWCVAFWANDITMEQVQVSQPQIGNLYHLSWASNRGYVWRLIKINQDGTCEMKTPRTNKPIKAKLKDLRYTNADILKIQKQTLCT